MGTSAECRRGKLCLSDKSREVISSFQSKFNITSLGLLTWWGHNCNEAFFVVFQDQEHKENHQGKDTWNFQIIQISTATHISVCSYKITIKELSIIDGLNL